MLHISLEVKVRRCGGLDAAVVRPKSRHVLKERMAYTDREEIRGGEMKGFG